jgi:hypothetical protein
MRTSNDPRFRAFMAKVLEHAMTTQRTPSFREQALRISKKLGLTMTCDVIERELERSTHYRRP